MTNHQYRRMRRLAKLLAARRIEAIRLYEPLGIQDRFHRSLAKRRIIRCGNRGGKTMMAAIEVAMAVTGQHPHIHTYPKKNGRCYIVARDGRAIGETLYPKLFKAGAFKIIRDKVTGEWRAFRPWIEEDRARSTEAKPAPPLIPPRFVKSIAWENKKENVPRKVILKNGWELSFFTSNGKPPLGMDIDLCWFDEEIVDPEWLPEMSARLLDRKGRFFWSATPQAGTEQFLVLMERAEAERGKRWPHVEEFAFITADNVHFSQEDRDTLAADLTEEEIRVRLFGEPAAFGFLMYPEFSSTTHGVDLDSDEWREIIPNKQIPANWARFLAIDPGNQVCAVLFAAVPPPSVGDQVYLYDELYIRNCDTEKFGDAMQQKCSGQTIEAFIIDDKGSARSEMIGKTIRQQFSEVLKKRGVGSVKTKHGFILGSQDVEGRCMVVRQWLRVRPDGTTKLRVLKGRLPHFEWEIKYYRRKRIRVNGEVVVMDVPDQRRRNHLMDCFDEQTEVLTHAGWMPFASLAGGELLATVNMQTNKIEYQQPTGLIAKRRAGDMVRIKGRKLDALVTPTHRMVVAPQGTNTDWRFVLARDLKPSHRIKMSGEWDGEKREVATVDGVGGTHPVKQAEIDAGDWAEFLGWYVAEGCCASTIRCPGAGYRVTVSQRHPEKRKRLESLLSRLPWKWNSDADGFYTSSKQLWNVVESLGHHCTEKFVPQWIKDSDPDTIKRFLEGALLGDGWYQGGWTYATTSRRLADDIQELFLKTGNGASIRIRPGRPSWCINGESGGKCLDQYWVRKWTATGCCLRDSRGTPNYQTEQYDGMVYCATVPNGTLIVRRNGKPMVAGNCLGYIAHYKGLHYVKPKSPPKKVPPAVQYLKNKRAKQRARNGSQDSYIILGAGSAA